MPRITKKQRLQEYLDEKKPAAVSPADWRELLRTLSPVSESYLRGLLDAAGVAVEPPYGGVRQSGFEQLEQSLLELESIYSGGDRERAAACRRAVIQAKDHARLASRNPRTSEEKRKQKEEMVQWMLVWLENPGVFPAWVAIRKRRLGLTADRSPTP